MEEGSELLQRLAAAWQQQDQRAQQPEREEAQQPEGQEAGRAAHGHAPGPLPLLTSCCPAWVNEVEQAYPRLLPHLSSCRSPQAMMGAVVKRVWAKQVRGRQGPATLTPPCGGPAALACGRQPAP